MRWTCLLVFAFLPGVAKASVQITALQVGNDLVFNATGSLDVSALSLDFDGYGFGVVRASSATVFLGPNFVGFDEYSGISGPTSFGSGGNFDPDSGSGGLIGLSGNSNYLRVPAGYTSGDLISAEMTFNNQSFASLGITPGTYEWSWGSGPNADSLTFQAGIPEQVIPEPTALVVWGLGGLVSLVACRRNSRNF